MAQGKMIDEEKQTISLYKQNRIPWDNADTNYRNKLKRSLNKVKLKANILNNEQQFQRKKSKNEINLNTKCLHAAPRQHDQAHAMQQRCIACVGKCCTVAPRLEQKNAANLFAVKLTALSTANCNFLSLSPV